jgi:FkbM family methyltransferase
MPQPTQSDFCAHANGSLIHVWKRWLGLRRVNRALAVGDGKRALTLLEGMEAPEWRVRALLAVGKAGAARKVMKGAVAALEAELGGVVEAGEQGVIEAVVRGEDRLVPLHLLSRLPRHVKGAFEVEGVRVVFPDGPSAGSAYQEIFVKRMYEIPPMEAPRMIDGGANIGLAGVFFKLRYPRARVTCFEADPGVAGYLKRNLGSAGAGEFEVVEAALWGEETVLRFAAEGSDAGRVGDEGGMEVRAVRLSPYLNEPVDLLKLDIEGAELEVLRECRNALRLVKRVFVEYHSFEGQEQGLDELLGILKAAGFRVTITVSDTLTWRPFVERNTSLGMDMRLNVFGVREL